MATPRWPRTWGYGRTAEIFHPPVLAVFITAALMALVLRIGICGLMGIAIWLLAMLNLMDVDAFAACFRMYDLLSKGWRPWGRPYPGIELLVPSGCCCIPRSTLRPLVGAEAVPVGAMGMVSVGKAGFLDHLGLNCACVGGNSRTSFGVVCSAQNLIMAAMGGDTGWSPTAFRPWPGRW